MSEMDLQQYLFDLQGYLLIEDVLDEGEVAELDRLLDARGLAGPGLTTESARFGGSGAGTEGGGLLEWGKPFCDLLDHPRIMPVLRMILGDGFRIDHLYGLYMREGTEALELHGGSSPHDQTEYFYFREGRMYNGLTVVSFSLAETGPEHGGFLCIPGSHKSNFPVPKEVFDAHEEAGCVKVPEARAGSAIIFTEALSHGTASWKAKYQRRSLLFKYCPSHVAYSMMQAEPPSTVELTQRQRLLFQRPSMPMSFGRPSLFEPELAPR